MPQAIVGLTPAATQHGELHIDGAAACLTTGILTSIAEERITRRKHAGGSGSALRALLADSGAELEDAHFFVSTCGERIPNPGTPVLLLENGPTLADLEVLPARVHWVPSHHLSHAHAAFELSGFERALVVVLDDAGSAPGHSNVTGAETRADIAGELERSTYYLADSAGYALIGQVRAPPPAAGGVGTMYRYVTDFLGLDGMTECGKTMALAALGRAGALPQLQLTDSTADGHVTRLTGPPLGSVEAVRNLLVRVGYEWLAPRQRHEPIRPEHADLARHTQEELEQAVLGAVAGMLDALGTDKLCLSGGVALNCVLAGKLAMLPSVKALHIPAAPGDSGQALGNCLYGARQMRWSLPTKSRGPYLGPTYPLERVRRACEVWGMDLRVERGNVADRVAEAIAAGKVVAVYHGRSEVGPRALGHRSILADPRSPRMRDYLNQVVKGREDYRPYGASILDWATENLFGCAIASPNMMLALPLTGEWRRRLPAVSHEDGTCRFQTVGDSDSSWLREIIESFAARTGVPAVLNTSFNAGGKPIVETPEDALVGFSEMRIDSLAIEEWFLEKTAPQQD